MKQILLVASLMVLLIALLSAPDTLFPSFSSKPATTSEEKKGEEQTLSHTMSAPAPGDDFNQYVNGEWLSKNSIPDDQNRWGSFMILREDNFMRCRDILEDPANKDTLVARLYRRAMATQEKLADSLVERLKHIQDHVKDGETFQTVAGELLQQGISSFCHVCKSEDAKNPNLRVPHIMQAGLGLPDMSYYTEREDLHEDYKQYIVKITKIFGYDVDAQAILDLEKKIAAMHMTRTDRRDPDKVYNKKDYSSEVAPLLPQYFTALNLPHTKMSYVIVENPTLLDFLKDFLPTVAGTTLRDYLTFQVANKFASISTEEAIEAHFDFNGKKLNGNKVIDPRWKRAVNQVEKYIGDELGKLYVAKHFPMEKQKECLNMVDDLKDSLGETLKSSTWMSEETKKQALEKLNKFGVKIGVPEEWHSIDGLWPQQLTDESVALPDAALEWYKWDWEHEEVAKFYTPPERKLWHMTPQTVNAYYHPEMNEIVFPAGILQEPFFGLGSYEANVGAIGVVIGHEMTHGFDDQGRKYNSAGELKDWWTEADGSEFDARAKVVEEHYGSQLVLGKPVNGKLTLGENIADIGGLKLALRAARKHYGKDLTVEQYKRFFEAYALIWRMLIRDELALKFLTIDPHSPCHLRINAALAHIDEFYATFDVKEGNGMFLPKEKRMNIW